MKNYRQALGCAPPPTIGFLTNQLLGILPTNQLLGISSQPTLGYLTNQLLGISYQPTIRYLTNQLLGISYQPTIRYLTNPLLGILPTNYWLGILPTNNGFFERWLKWSGISYQKGSNRQLRTALKRKTWSALSSLMRGCTRQPRKGQDLVLGPPLATHAFNDSGPSTTFL